MVERIGDLDAEPSELVDRCLDILGGIAVSEQTYASLVDYRAGIAGHQRR